MVEFIYENIWSWTFLCWEVFDYWFNHLSHLTTLACSLSHYCFALIIDFLSLHNSVLACCMLIGSRKSRDRWINRQIWPWNTEWSRAEANRVLPRECTGHSKHPHPTAQKKTLHRDITRRSILKSDWFYSLQPKMEKLYTVSKNKTGS